MEEKMNKNNCVKKNSAITSNVFSLHKSWWFYTFILTILTDYLNSIVKVLNNFVINLYTQQIKLVSQYN